MGNKRGKNRKEWRKILEEIGGKIMEKTGRENGKNRRERMGGKWKIVGEKMGGKKGKY